MGPLGNNKTSSEILLKLVESHDLFHVKTLRYSDLRGLLDWLKVKPELFAYQRDEDTIQGLKRYISSSDRTDIGVFAIDDECFTGIKDRKYIVVYIKTNKQETCKYDSIVLFLTIDCHRRAPYSRTTKELLTNAQDIIRKARRHGLFPSFNSRPQQSVDPLPQQGAPVFDGFLPSNYDTTKPKITALCVDSFGRKYNTSFNCEGDVNPWVVYTNIPHNKQATVDMEQLMTSKDQVLGRGGFGVTVKISDTLVAKTNMFPDVVNWSKPYIDDRFYRYAHVATQSEEVMMGVSMKHPNILRTFGGYWCDVPDYQLGGRAVVVMERALFSLQEFMFRLQDATVMPAVELDTLNGLNYLRSRCIQHRDFTFKNVLVCHEPNRKPLPFTFKISDFGTASNFSTPDQSRGNRVNMAPEVLWCYTTAMGSDIFSWYCVMWELYSRTPLIQYRGPEGPGYCKKTYAKNMATLLGVYTPQNPETAFEFGHMKAFDARALYEEHKHKRPDVHEIHERLKSLGSNITDKSFVRLGLLCITLYPQERWSPAQLLKLLRYTYLANDVTPANAPCQLIPTSIKVGPYKPTDIIVSKDCVSAEFDQMVQLHAKSPTPIVEIQPEMKVFYGIDLLRLAPDLIQPYAWYHKKAQVLEERFRRYYRRRAKHESHPHETRRARCDPGEGPSYMFDQQAHLGATTQVAVIDETIKMNGTQDPGVVEHIDFDPMRERPNGYNAVVVKDQPNVTTHDGNVENPSGGDPNTVGSIDNDELGYEDPELSQHNQQSDSSVCGTLDVVTCTRKREGEMDIYVVVLKSQSKDEISLFQTKVVSLSREMTSKHPTLFLGPCDLLYNCSRRNNLYAFQYALCFDCTRILDWVQCDSMNGYSFLLQVFYTLASAAHLHVLPTRLTHRCLVISGGAVMIDIVTYLSSNITVPEESLFGEHCHGLPSVCCELVAKHLPGSNLHRWFYRLNTNKRSTVVLTKAIEWLLKFEPLKTERTIPRSISMDDTCVTFKDYFSDISSWVQPGCVQRARDQECNAKILLHGNPKVFRGNQLSENMGSIKLETVTRNIIMRLKSRIFGSSLVAVAALDCTQGLTKVILDNRVLSAVPSLSELEPSHVVDLNQDWCYVHDAVSISRSKWAPVIMFRKTVKPGPVQELSVTRYSVVVLITLLKTRGLVHSLAELFGGISMLTTTEY